MPKLCQISFSVISDDPRVRRHNDALQSLGWEVAGLGIYGGRSTLPNWPIATVSPATGHPKEPVAIVANVTHRRALWKTIARTMWFAAALPLGFGIFVYGWILGYLQQPNAGNLKLVAKVVWTDIGWPIRVVRRLKQKPVTTLEGALSELERRFPIEAMIQTGETLGPADIWVANDWTALPVACALQAKFGGQVVYDSHEFATQEYAQDWAWRKYERPITVTIERHFIKQVQVVTSVSSGIVVALRELYGVNVPHAVVINAPPYQTRTLTPVQKPIKILYHGIVVPGRGLELLINAAKYWGDSAILSIRGPATREYHEALSEQIRVNNVAEKVKLLEPVAMTDLVEAASAFDLGIMALPGHSGQNRFALPNKIFEYLSAGLGLIVSDLPEMSALVNSTGTGLMLKNDEVSVIAAQIASLTPERVLTWKIAALEAAKHHNGGQSVAILDRLYRLVLAKGS